MAGLTGLLVVECLLVAGFPEATWLILLASVVGAIGALYVATEVIEEVRNTPRMLAFLSAVVVEFVLFFALEYWFLIVVSPQSFPGLLADPSALLLSSLMVFVFNPIYLPATTVGRVLLIVNTASALGLVLFVLQNVWQIRSR